MPPDFDVLIIGSGPAGVSAAFPLVEAGLKVLMIDGGKIVSLDPPVSSYLTLRNSNTDQSNLMIGKDFYSLKKKENSSPKLKVPHLSYVFEEYANANKILNQQFCGLGSLAVGGLSNAWGCGVACLSAFEAEDFPFEYHELRKSYQIIANRIGVSGCNEDDMADYFGIDEWSQPPIQMDTLHHYIFHKYKKKSSRFKKFGFNLGRSRLAVLSEAYAGRTGCTLSSNCLWGCQNGSIYSSKMDLATLLSFPNFTHQPGYIAENLEQKISFWSVNGSQKNDGIFSISSKKVILAAGTLATTRLAAVALELKKPIRVLTNPTAAFLLWVPRFTGAMRDDTFGLSQLSFKMGLSNGGSAFGSTFSTNGILVSDFVNYLPESRRYGIDIMRNLLSSCVVANVFLPGTYSSNIAQITTDGSLSISGSVDQNTIQTMKYLSKNLRKFFISTGAFLIPSSFKVGGPGVDAHYAGTLPMRENPVRGEATANGELFSLKGLYVADGACLPSLTEKSHTLTIMANADRIGRQIINS